MKPADLSPLNDDLSSQDSSIENEEPSPTRDKRSFCRKCDNCTSTATIHTHPQNDSESRMEEEQQDNNDNNTHNSNNNNSIPDNTTNGINNSSVQQQEADGCSRDPREVIEEVVEDSRARPKDTQGKSDADSPTDVDLMEVIKIPEEAGKTSIAEVLSQVVKMERSSSSSASEPARTPEAPDIVASTTKGRPRVSATGRRGVGAGHRAPDVATLAILCQHYAQLVQALKEENYLLSCAQSPLLATPKGSLRDSAVGDARRRPQLSGGRGRSPKTVSTWDSDYEQSRASEERDTSRRFPNENTRSATESLVLCSLGSPSRLKLHRSCSNSRDYINNNKTPRQSPTRAHDADFPPKERRHWTLKPLRSSVAKHKKDGRFHRKSSFSFFRDTENENLNAESGSDSPKLRRVQRNNPLPSPTVGVLSTKISEMELKIEEILKLEPVDLMLRENSLDRSPARRSMGSGDTLRRSGNIAAAQRGNFYRHSVKDTRRDQHRQEICDSDEVGEDGWRKGCGSGGGGGGGCTYQALAQAAHVEVDKLRQLVNLLNTRLTELSGRVLEAETRLREEQQRAASMERCLERRGLEAVEGMQCRANSRSPRSSSEGGGRRHGPSFLAWSDAASENLLRNKVDMAREEIELLRQHIDLLLRMRQEDLKVYESTVDKFRHTIATGSQW